MLKCEKGLAKCMSAARFRMVHTHLFLERKPKECYMLILKAALQFGSGKIY